VIDDNPNVCKSIIREQRSFEVDTNIIILAPHYPATANQHDERVLLVKNEVSDLKKEDFAK